MGMESRLEGRLKSFPLLFRLSRARLTSVKGVSNDGEGTVDSAGAWNPPAESERWTPRVHTFYLNVERSQILVR